MKKIALFAAIMGLSAGVQAAGAFGPITIDDCPLLAEGVTISLSSNVLGAWACSEATATRGAYVSTCSTAGRTSPRSVELPCNAADLDSLDPSFITGAATCDAEGNGPVETWRGSFIYQGSTRGGRITPGSDNDQECAQGTVDSVVDAAAAAS